MTFVGSLAYSLYNFEPTSGMIFVTAYPVSVGFPIVTGVYSGDSKLFADITMSPIEYPETVFNKLLTEFNYPNEITMQLYEYFGLS